MTTLADQQAALIAALMTDAAAPAGFDADRLRAAADALAFKRARAVLHAWPGLQRSLGATYRAWFAAYATRHPIPALGGPLADGRAFVRELASKVRLADDVRVQALALDSRFRCTRAGLVRRRVPVPRLAWLPDTGALAVAFGSHVHRFALARRVRA
jgi:hypothetical protein